MIEPTREDLENPYVIHLIETIAKLQDDCELSLDVIESFRHQVANHYGEVRRLEDRIRDLEEGACRFKCRNMKESFIAGYLADLQHEELTKEHANRAYQEWRDEQEG